MSTPAKIYVKFKNDNITYSFKNNPVSEVIVVFDDDTEVSINVSAKYAHYYPEKRPEFFVIGNAQGQEELYFIDYKNQTVNCIMVVNKFFTSIDFLKNKTNTVLYEKDNKFYVKNIITDVEKNIRFIKNRNEIIGTASQILSGDKYVKINNLLYDIDTGNCLNKDTKEYKRIFVSYDFLNGKTGFYCQREILRDNEIYYIFNKSKMLKKIIYKPFFLLSNAIYPDNVLFTLKTKYFSEVQEECINFYKIDHDNNNIEHIDTLKINSQYGYSCNLLSENSKFLVYEKLKHNEYWYLNSIFIYDIETKKIEYLQKDLFKIQFKDVLVTHLNTYLNALKSYYNGEKPYHFYMTYNDKMEPINTLNEQTKDNIQIIKNVSGDIYVATRSNYNNQFLIKINNQNNYQILTQEFYKPVFEVVNDNIFIIGVPDKDKHNVYLQILSDNIFTKLCDIPKTDFTLNINSELVNNLLFISLSEAEVYGLIYDIDKKQLHTPLKSGEHFMVRSFLTGLWNFFGVLNERENVVYIYDKTGNKIVKLNNEGIIKNILSPRYKILGDNIYPYSIRIIQKAINKSQQVFNAIQSGFNINCKDKININKFKV